MRRVRFDCSGLDRDGAMAMLLQSEKCDNPRNTFLPPAQLIDSSILQIDRDSQERRSGFDVSR
jgi:hypothetical protein